MAYGTRLTGGHVTDKSRSENTGTHRSIETAVAAGVGRQVLLQQVAKLLRSSGLHPELGLQVRNDAILGPGLFTLRPCNNKTTHQPHKHQRGIIKTVEKGRTKRGIQRRWADQKIGEREVLVAPRPRGYNRR